MIFRRPKPLPPLPPARGVTVYTGDTAEHYATADCCRLDDKGNLWVSEPDGRFVALFFIGTALRAEAGPYLKPEPK